MKNYTLKPKNTEEPEPPERPATVVELYAAPKPPANGRIIGIDCHPDTFTAAVMQGSTPHDVRKLSGRENMTLEALLAWACEEFTREDLFLMEAGANSFEIHRRLLALGLRAVVLESAHVGRQAKIYADNDKLAAVRMVRVFLAGNAPCVWVPDLKTCERRELLHVYQKAVADHVAASNTLKDYLNQFGIRLGSRGLHQKHTRDWILGARPWSSLQGALLDAYFEELDHQGERRKALRTLIAREICAEGLMLRCMKIMGIGMINAFALLAIIGDIRRFERPEKLVAYLGLNPGQRDSGNGKRIKLGIGRRGRSDLRQLLVQGAQAVLRMGRHSALGQWGWKLFARKGQRNIAVCAVARKMVVQVWHLLSGNPPTNLESDKSLNVKLQKLLISLGKKLRAELAMAPTTAACLSGLQARIQSPPASIQ